jgi:excisionase family DNA binding protein
MARIARRGQKSQQADVALIYADLIAIADAARELNVSQRSLRRWIADGRVQVIRFGRAVRIHRAELQRLKEEGIGG